MNIIHIMHIVARFLSILENVVHRRLKISLHPISYKRICLTEMFAQAQLIHAYIHYFHLKLQSNLFITPKMSIQCFFFIIGKDSYVYFFLLSFISNIAKRFNFYSNNSLFLFVKRKKNQVNIFIALNLPKKKLYSKSPWMNFFIIKKYNKKNTQFGCVNKKEIKMNFRNFNYFEHLHVRGNNVTIFSYI